MFTTKGGKSQGYWIALSNSRDAPRNSPNSRLSESQTIDDVFESAEVGPELILRRNADDVVHRAVGNHGGHDPVRLASSRGRLIRCFGDQPRLATYACSLVASPHTHVGIRSLQVTQQLI